MRDIVLKAMTSQDHMNRRLSFKEATEEHGASIKVEKDWSYSIKSVSPYAENSNLKPKKDVSICKTHNTKTGEDKFEYKITGDLFVINHNRIFSIEFSYYFSIDSILMSVKN